MFCGPANAAAPAFAPAPPLQKAALRTRRQRAGAEQHRDDHLRLRLGQLLAQSGEMAAGQVAGFVRQHPDDLVWRLRLQQRAMIDKNAMAVGDKRVEYGLIDDRDLDILLLEARRRAGSAAHSRARAVRSRCRAGSAGFSFLGERRPSGRSDKGDRGRDRGHFGRGFAEEGEANNIRRSLSIGGGCDPRYALYKPPD